MTSKEMERKALEQIKKIVADLGEDSYIGTALEGCLEIAEENINNDWACSMKQRWEAAEKASDARKERIKTLETQIEIAKELDKRSNENYVELEQKYGKLKEQYDDMEDRYCAANEQLSDFNDQINEKDAEILKLKAKLYDLIVKD